MDWRPDEDPPFRRLEHPAHSGFTFKHFTTCDVFTR
jgi:hypothetical protein